MKTFMITLPNRIVMHDRVPDMARTLHQQVQGYFRPRLLSALAAGDVTVVDVGANIGIFAIEVLQRTRGRARVHCFEPIPETFELLTMNLRPFGAERVRAHRAGLGRAAGEATFHYSPRQSAISSMYDMMASDDKEATLAAIYDRRICDKHHADLPAYMRYLPRSVNSALIDGHSWWMKRGMTRVTCPLTTLSEFMEREGLERIDVLKVDTEKAELDVLAGIRPGDWGKIRTIALELHDVEGRAEHVRRMLVDHGFEVETDRVCPEDVIITMMGYRG
ncbi:FkbM family methyltransferase [Sorangium sp. So ce385]|uniref:FkbM family methyltransferase n=1 Tax=Sorangium sp. So ce385 TaxID=3133308 RepID=UPI003F5B3FBF